MKFLVNRQIVTWSPEILEMRVIFNRDPQAPASPTISRQTESNSLFHSERIYAVTNRRPTGLAIKSVGFTMTLRSPSFQHIFGSESFILLDGGLGTTLDEELGCSVSGTPLWSGQPVVDDEDRLVAAHLAFLKCGARIISTSTYQLSEQTFERAGYDAEQGSHYLKRAVELASKARLSHLGSASDTPIYIALSLGPFGATLSPTQEFSGVYPEPFGTESNSDCSPPFQPNNDPHLAALARFHFDRLWTYCSDEPTWNRIDLIAFETVILAREVLAIRMAFGMLLKRIAQDNLHRTMKPWWISGVFPRQKLKENPLSIDHFVRAVFSLSDLFPTPSAIGVNCSALEDLQTILESYRSVAREVVGMSSPPPWLVIYPNGPSSYDPALDSWSKKTVPQRVKWAIGLVETVKPFLQDPEPFGGVIVGGCCQVGTKELGLLRIVLSKEGFVV